MFDNTKELLQELSLLERECAELSKENATLKEQLNALKEKSQHAQRVKRVAHWIKNPLNLVCAGQCSVCEEVTLFDDSDQIEEFVYCPYCGAKLINDEVTK